MWEGDTLRVTPPTDFIFVCGGRYSLELADAISMRHIMFHYFHTDKLKKYHYVMAEGTKMFGPSMPYRDIMNFEVDIAALAAVSIVFSESEGSLVELGMFASRSDIAKNLLVILKSHHVNDDEDSFVRLGPLLYLENTYGDFSFYSMNMLELGANPNDPPSKIDHKKFIDKVSYALNNRIANKQKKSTRFNAHLFHDQCCLVVGVLQDYGALTIDEIQLICGQVMAQFSDSRIKEVLMILQTVGWIGSAKPGLRKYYFANNSSRESLYYKFSRGSDYIDREKWRADVINYWLENDVERIDVIEKHRRAA